MIRLLHSEIVVLNNLLIYYIIYYIEEDVEKRYLLIFNLIPKVSKLWFFDKTIEFLFTWKI